MKATCFTSRRSSLPLYSPYCDRSVVYLLGWSSPSYGLPRFPFCGQEAYKEGQGPGQFGTRPPTDAVVQTRTAAQEVITTSAL